MKHYLNMTDAEIEALDYSDAKKERVRRYRNRVCVQCQSPAPADDKLCFACQGGKSRKGRVGLTDWSKVDWSAPVDTIAQTVGASPVTVRQQAKRAGVKVMTARMMRWVTVDWSRKNKDIAKDLGCTVNAVLIRRKKLAKPTA